MRVSKTVVPVTAQACVEVLGCARPCTLHPTSDLTMRYSNRRTRNLSSVAGAAHDAGLDRGAACGRQRPVGRDDLQVRRQPASSSRVPAARVSVHRRHPSSR